MIEKKELLDEAFIIVVDDAGIIQKGSSGTAELLGVKAANLVGTNLIEYLSPHSQFLLTDIIVNSHLGDILESQAAFLYTASRVIKGFFVEGKNVAAEQWSNSDREKFAKSDRLEKYIEFSTVIRYSLKFKYDDALTKKLSPLSHKNGFAKGASDIIRHTKHKLDMTFVSISGVKEMNKVEGMSTKVKKEFLTKVENKLGEESLDGAASCQLDDGKYALLHKSERKFDKVEVEINKLAHSVDPYGKVIKIQSKSIDLDSSNLSDCQIRNAINYAAEIFSVGDINDVIFDTLNESSNAYIDHALDRKRLLLNAMEGGQLTAVYSPVIDLKSWQCVHLWAKIRADFESDGLGASEIRRLVEDDPKLRARVDEDQCRIISENEWSTNHSISLDFNIHSLDNLTIIQKLILLRKSMETAKLIIRISGINTKNIGRLSSLETLKRAGLTLGLYGNELGAINSSLLKDLPVDFIVVDFDYTRSVNSLKIAMPMLRGLQNLCNDTNISLIFNGVESYEIAIILSELKDAVATGRYFGTYVEHPEQLNFKPLNSTNSPSQFKKTLNPVSELTA